MAKAKRTKINYLAKRDKLRRTYAKLAELHYRVEYCDALSDASILAERLRCIADEIDGLNR